MNIFDDSQDDNISLKDFKRLYNAPHEMRETILSELKAQYFQQENEKNYWKNEKSQRYQAIASQNSRKDKAITDIETKKQSLEEFQKADTFFKGYQRVTLNNVFTLAPDEHSGSAMCVDLHQAVQKALQNGNIEELKKDINTIKDRHNKQSFFTKMLKRRQNKKLDAALSQVVDFVKVQKSKINENPILMEKFCGDSDSYNMQKETITKEIDNLNLEVQKADNNISSYNSELQKIEKSIEKNVQRHMDRISNMPEISISADKIADIVIEDEINIRQAASFNMNFIQKGCDGQESNLDTKTASKAAKLIAAAGFSITDNPEDAKNTNSFYLKKGEIVTPFIAKEDLPKYKALLAMLRENGAEPTNLNIPTQPEQILREKPENLDIDISALVSEAAELGINNDNLGRATECAIEDKYNNKDYLYRGTMTADPTYVGSSRSGRQGIVYAADQIVDAAAYSGSKSQYGAGLSGTGDKYVDNLVTYMKDGKEIKGCIGFIHVYENHNNKMYNNWEIENKTYTGGDKDYETFLTTKNKHIATYLTISSPDGRDISTVFEIPKNDPRWNNFLKSRGVDPKLTYQNGREELFERMQAQLSEVKQGGKVNTLSFDGVKTKTSEKEWQEAADKFAEKSVHNNVEMTPPPIPQEAMTPPPPPVQGYTGANPPPIPEAGLNMPPPIQGYTGATPPPPPNVGKLIQQMRGVETSKRSGVEETSKVVKQVQSNKQLVNKER